MGAHNRQRSRAPHLLRAHDKLDRLCVKRALQRALPQHEVPGELAGVGGGAGLRWGRGEHWGTTRPECSRADQLGGELGKTRPESSRADLRRPHRELHPTHAPGGYSHYGGCSHTHPPVVVPLVQLHAVDHLLRQGQLHALVGRPEARRQNLEREKGTEGTVRRRREKKAQGAWRKG